ncbi:MAG: hypothetical protein Sv326_1318 (plasmid) [Candidatus Fermentimicrarchaeum limneticum]|uniref:Uncharacterized protein n=1 Tax=Fermentimicrarchaeum limneticum TaxID=2795018 RepID=A0A7D5XFY0_FERL1|nr:MAG: hypothetical protein Sv326_1318 [Candidatus Fermentimicrarchaeum limneticum]
MENIIGIIISVMIAVIVLYQVVLPTNNSAIMARNATVTETGWSNMTAGNWALTGVIQTLTVVVIVVYVVRSLLIG